MYQSYDAAAIHGLLGITPADDPHALIVHGTYDMPDRVEAWKPWVGNAHVAGRIFNLVIGQHQGKTVWYAPVLGAPLAAFVVHCACALGCKRIIQIGSFGGTRRGMAIGDLLLVISAGRGEAASDWYLEPGVEARADEGLLASARELLTFRGLPWQEGAVYTTPAFMAERWEDVLRWEREGYAGVEMESATTLAIAQSFGVSAVCILYLLDNLIEERDLGSFTEQDHDLSDRCQDLVQELALEIAVA
jgi:uridine phosphorylase